MTASGPILHVVQHLQPGGLEVMALELARAQSARHPAKVLSLEGDMESALAAWPRLAAGSVCGRSTGCTVGKRHCVQNLAPHALLQE